MQEMPRTCETRKPRLSAAAAADEDDNTILDERSLSYYIIHEDGQISVSGQEIDGDVLAALLVGPISGLEIILFTI